MEANKLDIFDQYILDELVEEYNKSDISDDDYKELYQRFCNISHLAEVQPYLITMRFFGLGTVAEKDVILLEMKEVLSGDDFMLKGLYYDLLLSEDDNNTDALLKLRILVDEGYTNKYTKEKTCIEKVYALSEKSEPPKDIIPKESVYANENVDVEYITFESNGYNGLYFASGDIDYLCAKVYIKPLHEKKHIKVRSQIFLNDDAWSKVFTDEYDIDSSTNWFKTTGWGNTTCNCYSNNIYKWVIEIDGDKIYSQEFRVYGGKIDKNGVDVKDVKLFASKAGGAMKNDVENYKTNFERESLEYIYFKFFINPLVKDKIVQIFIKVTCLEDNSVFTDRYVLFTLESQTITFWYGVGYSQEGKWKKGLYKYSIRIGNGIAHEGTFAVN